MANVARTVKTRIFTSSTIALLICSCTAGTGEDDGTTLTATEKLCPVSVQTVTTSCTNAASCTTDGQTSCLANETYPAAASTGLAAKVLTGNSVAGIAGSAVPAPSNCAADGATNCKAVTGFPATDAAAYSTWDVRSAKTIGGVVGSLKLCKSAARNASEVTTAPASGSLDVYDTIDDYGGGTFPTLNAFTAISGQICDATNWEDLTADGACDNAADDCLYRDRLTGLTWAEPTAGSTYTWSSAMSYCDGSTFAGQNDWRPPTQKEAMQAYVDGIYSLHASGVFSIGSSNYWSATTSSLSASQAFYFTMSQGQVVAQNKTQTYKPVCVRP